MKLTKRVILLFLFIVVAICLLWHFYSDYAEHKQNNIIQKQMDSHIEVLLEKIRDRKNILLTASVLLSGDKSVKLCLKLNQKEKCMQELKTIQEKLGMMSFSKNIKIHIHTKELKSFFRVWDLKNSKNDSLVFFRESLHAIKKSKKEMSGIEIGRFSMLLRGISPVIEKGEYLGSIEVISDFDKITRDFKKRGIDFYVLMDKKYQKIATKVTYSVQKYTTKHIVINNVNSELKNIENIDFKKTGYIKTKNHYITYTPIYDIVGEKIGFYVLKMLRNQN